MSIGLLDYLGVREDEFSWHMLGLCRGENDFDVDFVRERGDLFFDTYESDPVAAQNVDTLCGGCPVREQCLAAGIEGRQWGVWGGVYLNGSGPDLDRNSHKTMKDWIEIDKVYPLSDKFWAKIESKLGNDNG